MKVQLTLLLAYTNVAFWFWVAYAVQNRYGTASGIEHVPLIAIPFAVWLAIRVNGIEREKLESEAKQKPRSDAENYFRRFVPACTWAVAFFFGSAVLIGLFSGMLLFYFPSFTVGGETEAIVSWFGRSWLIVPIIAAIVGLLLGILGFLPGTRKDSSV